jgi:hypothetical protein
VSRPTFTTLMSPGPRSTVTGPRRNNERDEAAGSAAERERHCLDGLWRVTGRTVTAKLERPGAASRCNPARAARVVLVRARSREHPLDPDLMPRILCRTVVHHEPFTHCDDRPVRRGLPRFRPATCRRQASIHTHGLLVSVLGTAETSVRGMEYGVSPRASDDCGLTGRLYAPRLIRAFATNTTRLTPKNTCGADSPLRRAISKRETN